MLIIEDSSEGIGSSLCYSMKCILLLVQIGLHIAGCLHSTLHSAQL